jgi:DNA-binding transcriptional regulator YiaG
MSDRAARWDAEEVRALRERLGLTQRQLAEELGVRQQTVSEWETGIYQPRGASARMLHLVAERAGVPYDTGDAQRAERRGGDPHVAGSGQG